MSENNSDDNIASVLDAQTQALITELINSTVESYIAASIQARAVRDPLVLNDAPPTGRPIVENVNRMTREEALAHQIRVDPAEALARPQQPNRAFSALKTKTKTDVPTVLHNTTKRTTRTDPFSRKGGMRKTTVALSPSCHIYRPASVEMFWLALQLSELHTTDCSAPVWIDEKRSLKQTSTISGRPISGTLRIISPVQPSHSMP